MRIPDAVLHGQANEELNNSRWITFTANVIMGLVSTILTVLFISETMSADGFSAVDVIVTGAMGLALIALLVALQHYGLRVIPSLPKDQKTKAGVTWFTVAVFVGILSGGTSLMFVGTPMAKNLQFEQNVEIAIEEVYRPKASAAKEIGLLGPVILSHAVTAKNASEAEYRMGAFSGTGGGRGPTYTEINALHNLFGATATELVKARAETKALVNRGDDILEDIRAVKASRSKSWTQKTEEIRKLILELNVISQGLDEQMPIAVIETVIEATEKDWLAFDLSELASRKMQYTFAPIGIGLADELSRYKQANRIEIAPFEEMSGMALIAKYADRLFPLIIFCVVLEILPIAGVGMALLTSGKRPHKIGPDMSEIPDQVWNLDTEQLDDLRRNLFPVYDRNGKSH